ncbi:hypothetical protein [Streptomyces aureoverticillatus]|uniref:hypothetical protein n=1 Tax=Streptomyces aureoverticillatus TaxID=66871 RepID=UPI0013D96F73|nr:hypothetical protein [Streptomyces aureoverticillatus]QIB45529.1 hypothetical protein G3H79_23100 [Streptomyces aureoverticillatus]
MTTAPPMPPMPPQAPAPQPQGRRRARTGTTAIAAALVTALLAAGLGAWWWTRSGDEDPLAGRPRVTDAKTGLSYGIPEGWKRTDKGKKGGLIGAFTSSIGPSDKGEDEGEDEAGPETGATVLAGRSAPVPEPALKSQTERAARSNAEFFFPDGSSKREESKATTVDGRPAHTVALAVKDGEGGTAHLRLTLITVDDKRTAFLLGIAMPGTSAEKQTVDDVLASASTG